MLRKCLVLFEAEDAFMFNIILYDNSKETRSLFLFINDFDRNWIIIEILIIKILCIYFD